MPTDVKESAELARLWRGYSRKVYGNRYPLYRALAAAVAEDSDVLEMILGCRPAAHDPNMLMASIQYLILDGRTHPLADLYRAAGDRGTGLITEDAAAHLHSFCMQYRDELVGLMNSRHVQTNETGRCGGLALAMAEAAARIGEPLAFIDDGASAGLNLAIDHYLLDFGPDGLIGPRNSALHLSCELRGPNRPPVLRLPEIGPRLGLDRAPVDVTDEDATRWMLACIWPGTGRKERARAAMEIAGRAGVTVQKADMVADLPAALETMHPVPTVVVTSVSFSYLAPEDRDRFIQVMTDQGRRRPVAWVCCDLLGTTPVFDPGRPPFDAEGTPCVLGVAVFDGNHTDSTCLAYMHPHGDWLYWLPDT